MDYKAIFKFQADNDEEAKEIVNSTCDEMDSLQAVSAPGVKGELFYADGTLVPTWELKKD